MTVYPSTDLNLTFIPIGALVSIKRYPECLILCKKSSYSIELLRFLTYYTKNQQNITKIWDIQVLLAPFWINFRNLPTFGPQIGETSYKFRPKI